MRRRVRQSHVHDDQLGAVLLAFDDALRMRVEVVPRLEVRRDQIDDLGVGMIGTRPVEAHPCRVTCARAGAADVGVRVVAVDAPRSEHALGVAILAGSPDVVDNLVLAVLVEGLANARGDRIERLVPRDALPLALAAFPDPLQRVQNAVGVVDLVVRRRPLGTVAAARSRMLRVALELTNAPCVLVDVSE